MFGSDSFQSKESVPMKIRIFTHVIASLMGLLPASASASALSALAASMKPGEWKELKTEGFNVGGKNIMDRCVHSLLAYNNSVFWDSTTSQMYLLGSGHGEWATGNCVGFLRYDESANLWSTLEKPPFYAVMNHAWDHTAFDPVKREFYHKTSITEDTYKYSMATTEWTKIAGPFDVKEDNRYGALEYFPEMKSLFWYQATALYSLEQNKWTPMTNPFRMDNLGYNTFAEYNPKLKVMLAGGGGGSNKLYMVNPRGNFFKKAQAPMTLGVTNTVQFADPHTGMFIFYDMKSKVMYGYDVFADKWKAQGLPSPLLNDYGDYQNMVGGYLNTHKVAIFLQWKGQSSKIYLYKPDTGPSSPAPLQKPGTLDRRGMSIIPDKGTRSVRIRSAGMREKGYRLSAYDVKGTVLEQWDMGTEGIDVYWKGADVEAANLLIFRLTLNGAALESQAVMVN